MFLLAVLQVKASDNFYVTEGTHLVIAEKTQLVLESETILLDTDVAGDGEFVLAGKRKQRVYGRSALVCSNLLLRNGDSDELFTTTYIKNSLRIESGTLTLKHADLMIEAEGRLILVSGAAIKETTGGKLQMRTKFVQEESSSPFLTLVPFWFFIPSGKVAELRISESFSKDVRAFSRYQHIQCKSVHLGILSPPPQN